MMDEPPLLIEETGHLVTIRQARTAAELASALRRYRLAGGDDLFAYKVLRMRNDDLGCQVRCRVEILLVGPVVMSNANTAIDAVIEWESALSD